MSVRILIDMNLSIEWVDELVKNGWSAVHWSTVGDPRADDTVLIDWARANGHVIFTHDLDFGTALALTHATGPSIIQVRTHNILPEHVGNLIIAALRRYEGELAAGALLVVDEAKARVRLLPF